MLHWLGTLWKKFHALGIFTNPNGAAVPVDPHHSIINQAMLAKMGALWKRCRTLDLLNDQILEELEEYWPALDPRDAIQPHRFECLVRAPIDQSIPGLQSAMRTVQMTQYMLLRLLRRFGLGDSPTAHLCQSVIGIAHCRLGNHQAACFYLDRAVPAMRQDFPSDDNCFLDAVWYWANASFAVGRGVEELQIVEDIVARARKTGGDSESLRSLEEFIGMAYSHFDVNRARQILEDALETCRANHVRESPVSLRAIARLAMMEVTAGNVTRASELFSEAKLILDANQGIHWAEMFRDEVLFLAAAIEAAAGNREQQIHYLSEAIESAKRFHNARDLNLVEFKLELAEALCRTGQDEEALMVLEEVGEEGIDWMVARQHVRFLQIYEACGLELGLPLPIEQMQRLGTESVAKQVRQIRYISDESRGIRDAQELWMSIGGLLKMVLDRLDEQEQDPEQITIAEMFCLIVEFEGMVAETLCIGRERRLAVRYPECRSQLEQLVECRRQLQGPFREVFQGVSDSEEERIANHVRAQKRDLEDALRRKIPELRPEAPSVQQIAEALDELDENSVLIDFSPISADDACAGWAAFILPAGCPNSLRIVGLKKGPAISDAIVRLRRSLLAEAAQRPNSPAPDYKPLWMLLWSPIENVLDELREAFPSRQFRRLFICQDGILNWLPFEVLRDPQWDDGRYLIDEYEISYLTTARDILNIPDKGARLGGRSLVMGLCDFGIGRSSLRQAEKNAQLVSQLLNGELWVGKELVTKERILANLAHVDLGGPSEGYRSPIIVHCASHGFSLAEDSKGVPLHLQKSPDYADIRDALRRSGLALGGGGVLSAYEISGLDLRDTEMVVLSACESALGTISSGEGIFGLQRAFLIAGAQTLVMTLWPVTEGATTLLMEAFYARLLRGESRSAALRSAQCQVRRRLRWPASWGGFVCQGNPLTISSIVEKGGTKQQPVPMPSLQPRGL